jgi:hypothetical protein
MERIPPSTKTGSRARSVSGFGKSTRHARRKLFVTMVISHTNSVHEAIQDELLAKQDGLRRDVKMFFSLPIPNAVWTSVKLLQNQDFAAFIESSLNASCASAA